jgi:hypothetical protein
LSNAASGAAGYPPQNLCENVSGVRSLQLTRAGTKNECARELSAIINGPEEPTTDDLARVAGLKANRQQRLDGVWHVSSNVTILKQF